MDIVLKTIHGSKLYGTSHKDSDSDYYVVVNNRRLRRRAHQTIVDGVDTLTIDLSYWLHLCEEGVCQALEALFAPAPEIDVIADLRASYKCNIAKATRTYNRTIRNFYEAGDSKRARHSLRLWLNLQEIQHTGRFNPVLSPADREWVTEWADQAPWFLQD